MRNRLQLLLIAFSLAISSAAVGDIKAMYPSYIGEYSERQASKSTKVDFPRCRQLISYVVVSQSGEWYILAECDIDQPKIKSIRIWRTKLEAGVGLKIHGEIILPWRKLQLSGDEYPEMCNRKGKQEFNVVGYIGLSRGKVSLQSGLAYVLSKDDGTIEQVPYTEIDSCDLGERGTLSQSGIR